MFPVAWMCQILNVSTSGYYDSIGRAPSKRARRRRRIKRDVERVYRDSHGIYGSWKIADILQRRDDLESACRNTVADAMRALGLKSRVCKTFKPITTRVDPSKRPADNLLNREFTADAPDRKWVTDITYLPTKGGWVCLAVVMDMFSRRIVGWSLSDSLATRLVSATLRHAVETRHPNGRQLLHHSDRGCQYTSDAYQHTLRTLGITCSMSRTGCCYDNAAMERFFGSLKQEWTNHCVYENITAARASVFQYIEVFYDRERIHAALGYMTPEQYEAINAPASKVA